MTVLRDQKAQSVQEQHLASRWLNPNVLCLEDTLGYVALLFCGSRMSQYSKFILSFWLFRNSIFVSVFFGFSSFFATCSRRRSKFSKYFSVIWEFCTRFTPFFPNFEPFFDLRLPNAHLQLFRRTSVHWVKQTYYRPAKGWLMNQVTNELIEIN